MTNKFKIIVLAMVLLIIVSNISFSQTNSVTWFNKGIKAQLPNDKIVNYLKAIELDPKFIQAYYNLGYVYKEIGDFSNAEKALRQALLCDPSKLSNDDKLRISYELGLTLRKLNRFNEAVKAFESAKKLTRNDVFLAAIFYELGRTKVIMGNYDEAISEFEQGIKLNSDKRAAFLAASREANKLKSLDQYYIQATDLLQQNKLSEAEETLLKIINIEPNYKDAMTKLSEVRDLNTKQYQNNELTDNYNRALGFMNSNDWTNAISSLEKIIQVNPNFKEANAKLAIARSNLNRSAQIAEYEKILQQGISEYNRKNWKKALVAFKNVRTWDANYKNVGRWYQNTLAKIRTAENENTKLQYYTQGKSYLKKGDNKMAIDVLNKLIAIDTNYRDVHVLRNEALKGLDKKSRQKQFDLYYAEGLEHFKKQEWLQATVAFEEAKHINPDDSLVLQKLADAESKLKEKTMADAAMANNLSQQNNNSTESGNLLFYGIILIAIILPSIVILRAPSLKAKIYLKRGEYQKAATIYESILARKPHKIKLYLALANIYLIQSRNDLSAQKVYNLALQQKLDPVFKEKLTLKLSQKTISLDQGQDAESLENMLKEELDRLKNS